MSAESRVSFYSFLPGKPDLAFKEVVDLETGRTVEACWVPKEESFANNTSSSQDQQKSPLEDNLPNKNQE